MNELVYKGNYFILFRYGFCLSLPADKIFRAAKQKFIIIFLLKESDPTNIQLYNPNNILKQTASSSLFTSIGP